MFAAAAMPVERPDHWRSNSYHNAARSPPTSPAVSRRNSVSSVTSAKTEPGLFSDNSRQSSVTSTTSMSSNRSGFRGLFGKKDKKPKEKKDVERIVLTSRHAAAVKTKMMMDPRYKDRKPVKTAGITSSIHTGHITAAEQEARHPHSGPPALHVKSDMPLLTRIISGDERDEEEEFERVERTRLEWDMAKQPGVSRIREHESDESVSTSAEQSADEDNITPPPRTSTISPNIEKALLGAEPRRPAIITKNSYGGRFQRDENGRWKR